MMPVQNLNTPLATVALPMLSRLSDEPQRYRAAYLAIVERLAMVLAPVAALVIAGAPAVIALALGSQWGEAAPILAWLGAALLYMPVTYTLSWLYMSQDRTSEMLRANAINVTLTLVAIFAALPFGVEAIAATFVVTGALIRSPFVCWYVARSGPIRFKDFGRIFLLPVLATGAGVALIEGASELQAVADLSAFATFLLFAGISAAGALAVYGAAPHGRRVILETLQMRRHLMRQEAQA